MTHDIAERLALVFPTAALQKPGVTGVTNVADVTAYAQKPQELRQLRLLRQENDNAGKMPDEGVVADVASPIATNSGAIEEWAALATEERSAVSAAQAREAARAAGVRLEAHGEDLILEADVAPTTDVADAQTRKKPCVLTLLRTGATAGRAKTGGPSSTNGRESPNSTAGCRAKRPKPAPSRAASQNGSTAIGSARRPTAAFAAGGPSTRTTRCCRSEPSPPATPGCIRAAGRLGMPRGNPRRPSP